MKTAKKLKVREATNRSPVGRYAYAGKLRSLPDPNSPPAITDSQATAICREFKLPTEKIRKQLIEHVNQVAQIYWINWLSQFSRPKTKEIKSEIKAVQELTERLLGALTNLSPQAAKVFWRPELSIAAGTWRESNQSRAEADRVQVTHSEFGHSLLSVQISEASFVSFYIDEERHYESLKVLSAYSANAIKSLTSGKAGRPKSEALNLLVTSNVNFWRELVGREFRADYKNGDAANLPMHFVAKLAQIVDPAVTTREVITVARRIIKNRRRLPNLKNPSDT